MQLDTVGLHSARSGHRHIARNRTLGLARPRAFHGLGHSTAAGSLTTLAADLVKAVKSGEMAREAALSFIRRSGGD